MDGLAELIPLLLVGAYYLLQGRRRAAQRRAADAAPLNVQAEEPSRPTPFQAFVTQMEEALAEASGEPVEPASASPDLPRPSAPAPPLRSPEFIAPAGSFDSSSPTDHESHGFGPSNPASEEAFEQAPAFGAPSRRSTRDYDPHGLKKRSTPPPPVTTTWRTTLRDPKAARDAFVLQTIFGSRGGRRSDPR